MTDRPRTPRTLLIPDHVWQAYEVMAADMGTDREALVSQALFSFARLNGFLVPSDLARLSAPPPAAEAAPAPARPAQPAPARPLPRPAALARALENDGAGATLMEGDLPARPPRNADRVAELAQQLAGEGEAGLMGSPIPTAQPVGRIPLTAAPGTHTPAVGGGVEVDDALLGDDANIQATSMELPNLSQMGLGAKKPPVTTPSRPVSADEIGAVSLDDEVSDSGGGARTLILSADGRELDRVTKDRFLIGRGKHCDLIINSGKVSREHAAITREGSDYFIEDLGSSNGTWFDKRRITKRQIQEGDEYFICAEKLSCSFG